MNIAYIAHPIGGDVEGNLEKIRKIILEINLTEPDTVPFALYYTDCITLDDNDPDQRERGMKNSFEFFNKKAIDEVRLYGDRLSNGMKGEVELASWMQIPILAMTKETEKEFAEFQRQIGFEYIKAKKPEFPPDRNV